MPKCQFYGWDSEQDEYRIVCEDEKSAREIESEIDGRLYSFEDWVSYRNRNKVFVSKVINHSPAVADSIRDALHELQENYWD